MQLAFGISVRNSIVEQITVLRSVNGHVIFLRPLSREKMHASFEMSLVVLGQREIVKQRSAVLKLCWECRYRIRRDGCGHNQPILSLIYLHMVRTANSKRILELGL